MKPESKKRLEDFVERAEQMRKFSYFDGKDKMVGFEIKEVNGEQQIDYYQPNDEQLAAVLLHLRIFRQDKDNISFRKLAELCDDSEISERWKMEFESERRILNIRLNQVAAERKTERITHGDILDMFLFGKIAHNNPNDKANKLYEKWVTSEFAYNDLYNTFHTIIIWFARAVLNISSASKEELQRYRN